MINYSIIIPHHNIPLQLQRCLDSLPVRDDFQIIVVDDNSDPAVVDFDSFPGKDRSNVEIYYTKEGKGAGYARNVGLLHAKGKYLIFADADDFFYRELSTVCDKYLHSNADIVFWGVNSRNSDSLELSVDFRADELEKLKASAINQGTVYLLRWNNRNVLNVPWGKMIKKSLVEENDINFEEVLAGNDAMFSLKCALRAKEILVDKNLVYCVTTREGSLTRTVNRAIMQSRWGVACRINQELFKNNLCELRYNLFIIQWRYLKKYKKDFLRAFMEIVKITPFQIVLKDLYQVVSVTLQKVLK